MNRCGGFGGVYGEEGRVRKLSFGCATGAHAPAIKKMGRLRTRMCFSVSFFPLLALLLLLTASSCRKAHAHTGTYANTSYESPQLSFIKRIQNKKRAFTFLTVFHNIQKRKKAKRSLVSSLIMHTSLNKASGFLLA